MENTPSLKVSVRTTHGKGPARQMRMKGNIPGVCYGKGFTPVSVEVDPKELASRLTGEFGLNALFRLEIEGHETSPVVRVSQYQRNPVKRNLEHVEFHAVNEDQTVLTRVPLKLLGRPVGLGKGGALKQIRHDVRVRGLAKNIPAFVTVDVAELDVNEMCRISKVQAPEGVNILFSDDFGVAQVLLTRSARAAQAESEA